MVAHPDRPRKDRMVSQMKAQMQLNQAMEAEMETRVVGETPRHIVLICSNCRFRNEYDIDSGVPIVACTNCNSRLVIPQQGAARVVSR